MANRIIVGLFDKHEDAEHAENALEESEFVESDIDLLKAEKEGGIKGLFDGGSDPEDAREFFQKKGLADSDAQFYAQNLSQGSSLLIVESPSENVSEVTEMLDTLKAKEVYEHIPRQEAGAVSESEIDYGTSASQTSGRSGELSEGAVGEDLMGFEQQSQGEQLDDQIAEGTAARHYSESAQSSEFVGDRSTETPHKGESLQAIEEDLKISKQAIQEGGVRAQTTTSEERISEEVPLKEQHVEVRREHVDRPAKAGEELFEEKSIEAMEFREEPIVSKEARVTEEVSFDKDIEQRTETVSDTVRRQDVEIEELGQQQAHTRQAQAQPQDFDHSFRQHYHQNYAGRDDFSFDNYQVAYRYGVALGQSPDLQSRDFSSIESQAQESWEEQNKGTWEKFKDAIRYGFDKIRGEEEEEARHIQGGQATPPPA